MQLSEFSDQRTKLIDNLLQSLAKDYEPDIICKKVFAVAERLKKFDENQANKLIQKTQALAPNLSTWYGSSALIANINKLKNEILVKNFTDKFQNLSDAEIKTELTKLSSDDKIKFVNGILNNLTSDRSNQNYEKTENLLAMFNLQLKHRKYEELSFDRRRARRAAFMGSLQGDDERSFSETYKKIKFCRQLRKKVNNLEKKYLKSVLDDAKKDEELYKVWIEYAKENKRWYLYKLSYMPDLIDEKIVTSNEFELYRKLDILLYNNHIYTSDGYEQINREHIQNIKDGYQKFEEKYGSQETFNILKFVAYANKDAYQIAVNVGALPNYENIKNDNQDNYDFDNWPVTQAIKEENLGISEDLITQALEAQRIKPEEAMQMNFADLSDVLVEEYGNRYGFVGLSDLQEEDDDGDDEYAGDYIPSSGIRADFWRKVATNKSLKKFMSQDWLAHGVKKKYIDEIFDNMDWRGNPRFRGETEDGDILPRLDLDHIVPLHKGGKNEFSNLRIICSFGDTDLHRDVFHQTDDPSIRLYSNSDNNKLPSAKRYKEGSETTGERIYEYVEPLPQNVVYMSGLDKNNMFIQERKKYNFIGKGKVYE